MVALHVVTLSVRVQIPLVTPKKFYAALANVVIAEDWKSLEPGSIPGGGTTINGRLTGLGPALSWKQKVCESA